MSASDTESVEVPPAEFYDQDDSDNVCFLCGNPQYTLVYELTHFGFPFQFQRCQCGLEKQTPMPNGKFFEWFWNSDTFYSAKKSKLKKIWGFYDYFADEPCRLATSKYRYRRLSRIFKTESPLKIMKIGGSTGTMLYVAKQHGHDVLGSDRSSAFAEYGKEHYDVDIDIGAFEEMDYADERFDVIMLFNVVENIPNQEEFFKAVHRKLKPGGHFILNHVDMKGNVVAKLQKQKYFLYRPPICYIYDHDVLKRILGKYGFDIVGTYRDVRYMHLEKILTLLDWPLPLRIARLLHISRIPFPIYAYPSHIVIGEKRS